MKNWERARTDEQKAQRISEIINATARLYQKQSFEEITFVSIAKEAHFTRSNLYKYFNTKEEIFLEFLKHDIVLWRKDLIKTFQDNRSYSIEEFAGIWAKVLVDHKRLLDLISILYTYLEKNASLESMIDFKKTVNLEYQILTELLCGFFPKLSLENAAKFLNIQLAASIGLYTMTDLSERQKKILEMPEFQHFQIDFNAYFKESVKYLIEGLLDR